MENQWWKLSYSSLAEESSAFWWYDSLFFQSCSIYCSKPTFGNDSGTYTIHDFLIYCSIWKTWKFSWDRVVILPVAAEFSAAHWHVNSFKQQRLSEHCSRAYCAKNARNVDFPNKKEQCASTHDILRLLQTWGLPSLQCDICADADGQILQIMCCRLFWPVLLYHF